MSSPNSRPSGTVTFLFSDIEGSVQRWERDRDAMAAALARHNELLRTGIEAHGGYVFKTMGDAFCAVFAAAPEATAAALHAQRALAAEDFSAVGGIRVRMALHAGYAEEHGGDYFGPALNRVARLVAVGYGGQILISAAAAELLRDSVPDGVDLRDLGAHRLSDLARPERIYQAARLRSARRVSAGAFVGVSSQQPAAQLTSFVGRTGRDRRDRDTVERTSLGDAGWNRRLRQDALCNPNRSRTARPLR